MKYFDGTEYQTVDAVLYSGTATVYTDYFVPSLETWDTEIFNSEKWLRYDLPATIGIYPNPSYIQVDFSMTCTFKETDRLITCVAACNSASASGTAVSSIYSSATLETFQNGVKTVLTSSDNGDYIQACSFGKSTKYTSTFIPVNLSFVQKSTVVLGRACFYGVMGKYIFVRVPTVSLDAVAENGDTSGSGSGGSGGSVDLGETNGLLGTIVGWLQGVFDSIAALPGKIAGLFIPSDEFFDDWKNTVSALWSDHFGAVIQAIDIIASFINVFQDVSAQDSIYIPTVTIDVGSPFTLGGWTVPLKPDGFSVLFESLALIIDILATCWVVNALKCRHDRILTGGAAD